MLTDFHKNVFTEKLKVIYFFCQKLDFYFHFDGTNQNIFLTLIVRKFYRPHAVVNITYDEGIYLRVFNTRVSFSTKERKLFNTSMNTPKYTHK